MLQIARVESGEEAFEITAVSIAKVVDACIRQFTRNATRKNIDLVVDAADGGDVVVQAEEDGLLTILDNLVSNAISYTPEGGRVTIRWRSVDGFAEPGSRGHGDRNSRRTQDSRL